MLPLTLNPDQHHQHPWGLSTLCVKSETRLTSCFLSCWLKDGEGLAHIEQLECTPFFQLTSHLDLLVLVHARSFWHPAGFPSIHLQLRLTTPEPTQLHDSTSLSTRHAELHACLIASVPRCTRSRADRVRLRCSGSLAQKNVKPSKIVTSFLAPGLANIQHSHEKTNTSDRQDAIYYWMGLYGCPWNWRTLTERDATRRILTSGFEIWDVAPFKYVPLQFGSGSRQ
jgi:hypothetical protein